MKSAAIVLAILAAAAAAFLIQVRRANLSVGDVVERTARV